MQQEMERSYLSVYTVEQLITEILSQFNTLLKYRIEEYGYYLISSKKMDSNNLIYVTFDFKKIDDWDLQKKLEFFLLNYNDLKIYFEIKDNFLRSLLFEVKYFRNLWAHQRVLDLRDAYRLCDSILYIADIIFVDQDFDFCKQIIMLRDKILGELVLYV